MCGFCLAASIACCVMVVAALYYCARERRDLLRALLEWRVDKDTPVSPAAKTAQAKAIEKWRHGGK